MSVCIFVATGFLIVWMEALGCRSFLHGHSTAVGSFWLVRGCCTSSSKCNIELTGEGGGGDDEKASATKNAAPPTTVSPKLRVLLVDDEASLRRAVSDYLMQMGYEVECLSGGHETLGRLIQKSGVIHPLPDVIVSDVTMPTMDGYSLLAQLRAGPIQLRNIPVLFLTARGMTEDRIQGYRAGVNAYLPKPFDPEELVSIIDNLHFNANALQGTDRSTAKLPLEDTAANDSKSQVALVQELVSLQLEVEKLREAKAISDTRENSKKDALLHLALTPKEEITLGLLCQGCTNREIANELGNITVRHVERLVASLLDKTGTRNRTELVRLVMQMGQGRTST